MADYILRKIDAELWRKFKAKVALHGYSIKGLIEAWIRAYVKD